jgi:excalibur calcium-binding domain-containing protein
VWLRHAFIAVVLATAGMLPLAGLAQARPDRDCPDFASQAEAQKALDGAIGDPERLDRDNDGIACESYFREAAATTTSTAPPTPTTAPTTTPPTTSVTTSRAEGHDRGQVRVLPKGGVDTGDGSADLGRPASGTTLAALAGLGLMAAAAGTRRLRQDVG